MLFNLRDQLQFRNRSIAADLWHSNRRQATDGGDGIKSGFGRAFVAARKGVLREDGLKLKTNCRFTGKRLFNKRQTPASQTAAGSKRWLRQTVAVANLGLGKLEREFCKGEKCNIRAGIYRLSDNSGQFSDLSIYNLSLIQRAS
ncbi:hypothetical protein Ancab_034760 [Ancistrocladus abbreviatus]